MDRRSFLTRLVGGVAATAAVRTWPFRVYSFPSEVVLVAPFPNELPYATLDQLNAITQKVWNKAIADSIFAPSPLFDHLTTRQHKPISVRRG